MLSSTNALDVRPLTRLFRALGDETRLRIVALLSHGELCVCHLEAALDLNQSNASRQLGMVAMKAQTPRRAAGYIAAQIGGGIAGAILANAMFELPLVTWSATPRAGSAQLLSEGVATFGLLGVVIAVGRTRAAITPLAVAAYIVAAYWFTASTSFANPAVTVARAFSDTFAGIRPGDVAGFLVAQAFGAAAGALVFSWLVPARAADRARQEHPA